MPKVTLKNGQTGKNEEFEPVDAREILAQKDTIYSVTPEAKDAMGVEHDPLSKDLNVPQLQGADAEMQTGLSTEKYRRAAVVKAEPGDPDRTLTVVRADQDDGKAPEPKRAAEPARAATPKPVAK